MQNVRGVYMVTDMEGVACVDDWDPRHKPYADFAKGVFERSEIQRMMTAEINAAAEALFAAGVEEVIVNDGHGAGRSLLPEELAPGIRIARGKARPHYLIGCSPHLDALVQVGMHAMAGTETACLAHTMSKGLIYRINGTEVGEMELAAYAAGEMGLRWIFTSGDLHACTESERFVSNIVTAPVKEGLSELCAIHLTPGEACRLISQRIVDAVERARDIEPLVAKPPVTLEIEKETPFGDDLPPGAERLNKHTVRYTGTSVWQLVNRHHYRHQDFPFPQGHRLPGRDEIEG